MNLGPPRYESRSRSRGLGEHFHTREGACGSAMLACPDVLDGNIKKTDLPFAFVCQQKHCPTPRDKVFWPPTSTNAYLLCLDPILTGDNEIDSAASDDERRAKKENIPRRLGELEGNMFRRYQ